MSSLRERIKEVRIKEGCTADSFAQSIDEKIDSLRNTELGRKKVPGEMLQKIVQVFGVDAHWLLTGIGQMYPSDQPKINKEPALYRSDIIDNRHQAQITAFIEHWYKTSSDEEKVWMNIQMQRCFPEFKDFIENRKADSLSQKKQAGE